MLGICSSLVSTIVKEGRPIYIPHKIESRDEKDEETSEDSSSSVSEEEIDKKSSIGSGEGSKRKTTEKEPQSESDDETVEEAVHLLSEPSRKIVELRLAHFSVKEYLVSDRVSAGKTSRYNTRRRVQRRLAQTCLTYLLFFDDPAIEIPVKGKEYPLIEYVAKFWLRHARTSVDYGGSNVQRLTMKLFKSGQAYFNFTQTHEPINVQYYMPNLPLPGSEKGQFLDYRFPGPSPLYFAARFGALEPLKWILDAKPDIDAKYGSHGTALHVACYARHQMIAISLLKAGADVNVEPVSFTDDGPSALHLACERESPVMVKQLLDAGADVNAEHDDFGRPNNIALGIVCRRGQQEMFLQYGVDLGAYGGIGLLGACYGGHYKIVERLIEAGVDVNYVIPGNDFRPQPYMIITTMFIVTISVNCCWQRELVHWQPGSNPPSQSPSPRS